MDPKTVLIGLAFATFGGAIVITLIVDFCLWKYARGQWKKQGKQVDEYEGKFWPLSLLLGILERAIYMGAFLMGNLTLVGGWLVLKAAAGWGGWRKEGGMYNIFLIGNSLSIIFGFLGAWIAKGSLPTFGQ